MNDHSGSRLLMCKSGAAKGGAPSAGYTLACYLGAFLLVFSAMAAANPPTEPFAVKNMNPFVLVYGLPTATSADLLSMGESSLQLQFDIINHSTTSGTPLEQIILDGETYRAALIYKWGIADGWQLGLELPVIAHRPGFMDNFIEDWHDALGLSNSDRDDWTKNRLLFSYTHNGIVAAEMTEGSTGVGDLQLQLSRRLTVPGEGNRLSLNVSLKLPSGDVGRFQGSGCADLALSVSGAAPALLEAWHIGAYLQAGVLLLGEGDLLPDRQRDRVGFGSAGMHWRAWSWLILKAQLDLHGPFYDSQLDQLGKRSVMLTVGGTIPLDQGAGAIDLAIGENLFTDTVPDFMINLAYRHRF